VLLDLIFFLGGGEGRLIILSVLIQVRPGYLYLL
jgi:hypothetical protein